MLRGVHHRESWDKCLPYLESEQKQFINNCMNDRIFVQEKKIKTSIFPGNIKGSDCINQYTRLRSKDGSDINSIGSKNNYCAYCGVSIANTVDHILPKDEYSQLSICLENMVPCCSSCNQKKLAYVPKDKDELLFNPNYNSFYSFNWININSIIREEKIVFESCFNNEDDSLTLNQLNIISNTVKKLDILKSFNLVLDTIYYEDFPQDFLNEIILNQNKLQLYKEDIKCITIKNNTEGFLSERNFLKYRLLCYFETEEFKDNYYSINKS